MFNFLNFIILKKIIVKVNIKVVIGWLIVVLYIKIFYYFVWINLLLKSFIVIGLDKRVLAFIFLVFLLIVG